VVLPGHNDDDYDAETSAPTSNADQHDRSLPASTTHPRIERKPGLSAVVSR